MKKGELIWLKRKIEELKQISKKTENRCKKLVEEIYSLDDKLENIKKQLEKYGKNSQSRYKNINQNNNNLIKKYIKKIIDDLSIPSIILTIIIIPQTENILVLLLAELIMLLITSYPYIKKYQKEKTEISIVEALEIEYQQTLDRRLSLGTKYREYYEAQTMANNIYKVVEQLLSDKIDHPDRADKDNTINMNDIDEKISEIYPKYSLSLEDKKIYLDYQLKNYLIEKITEKYPSANKNKKLNKLSVEELIIIITNIVPYVKNDQNLIRFIEFILKYASNLQGRIITLYEDSETTSKEPEIIYDSSGKWLGIKYSKNIDYLTLFQSIYQNFQNKFMNQQTAKTRTKK